MTSTEPVVTRESIDTSPAPSRLVRLRAGTWSWLRGISVWQWGLVAVVALYTWYFTKLTLDIHYGLGTSTFDYALYDQGVWLMSRFKTPFVTLMGRNLLGDHTSLILGFLVPVYWVVPGAGTLLFTQSLAAAVSTVPVFLYARLRLGSEALALLIASLFLLHPALQWSNLEEFHPDMYLAPLLTFAIYAALTSKWRLYAVMVMLSLLVKEDVSLVIVPLGLWVALRRDRFIGLATIGVSLAYGFFAVVVVMQGLVGSVAPNAWRIPFGGVGGFLREIITQPGNVVDYLLDDGRPWYVWQMMTPFAWLMMRAPEIALISGVVLGTNIISNFGYQHQIGFHYSVAVLPALALGTVYAMGLFQGRRRVAAVVLLTLSSVWAAYLWGPLPQSRQQVAYWAPDHPVALAARDIIEGIPDDAVISTYYAITPHLARREQIYSWPNPFQRVMYGTDISLEGTVMAEAESVEYVVLPAMLSEEDAARWEGVSQRFTLVDQNDFWLLYRAVHR